MAQFSKLKWQMALAACSGLLLTGAFPKIGLHWIAWIALVPLLVAIKGQDIKASFHIGFVAGMAHFLTLVYWVAYTMRIYGYLPWPVCISVLVLLSAVLALYVAVFSAAVAVLRPTPGAGIAVIPLIWISTEYLRGFLFTGFPWEFIGHSQFMNLRIIQIADMFGVHGISALIVLVNAVIAALIPYRMNNSLHKEPVGKKFAAAAAGTGLLFLALTLAYGDWRLLAVDRQIDSSPALQVAVVQGNVEQSVKWKKDFQIATIDKYLRLSDVIRASRPELIVWPETALPFYYGYSKPLTQRVVRGLQMHRSDFLFGAPAFSRRADGVRYYNSAFLVNSGGTVYGTYSKAHLVPFGEYVPLQRWLPFLGKMVAQVGDFTPGEVGETIAWKDRRLGVLICYEAIFPYISRAEVLSGATLLVNITNDAWYGFTSAPYQLFSMTVFRAVESRRALVRAANTGISGFIDPAGRVLSQTDLFEEGAAAEEMPLLSGQTLYVRFGDIFALCALAMTLAGVLWRAARQYGLRKRG